MHSNVSYNYYAKSKEKRNSGSRRFNDDKRSSNESNNSYRSYDQPQSSPRPTSFNRVSTVNRTSYNNNMSNAQINNAMLRYCDQIVPGQENPRIIGEILNDLHCIFEKTFGNNLNADYKSAILERQMDDLSDEVCCLEECKRQLEMEILRQDSDLGCTKQNLEIEMDKRICAECQVCDLKEENSRLVNFLNAEKEDKGQLIDCAKEMEFQIKSQADIIDVLKGEKDDLEDECKCLQEELLKKEKSMIRDDDRCCALEITLQQCCECNNQLQKDICVLKKEIEDDRCQMNGLVLEKKKIMDECQDCKEQWDCEREKLEQCIAELKRALDAMNLKNQEVCQSLREIVAAHHNEMDCLRKEGDKLKQITHRDQDEIHNLRRSIDQINLDNKYPIRNSRIRR